MALGRSHGRMSGWYLGVLAFWVWLGGMDGRVGVGVPNRGFDGSAWWYGGNQLGVMTFQGVSIGVVEYVNIILWVILLIL